MPFSDDSPLRMVRIPFEEPSHDLTTEPIPLFRLKLNSFPIGFASPEAFEGLDESY